MRNTETKKEIVKEFRSTLNNNSKFFNTDMQSFNDRLKAEKDNARLITQLGNLRCLNGKSRAFNDKLKKFTKELDAAGMFDMNNMKTENALD
jgi:hypothetical protein